MPDRVTYRAAARGHLPGVGLLFAPPVWNRSSVLVHPTGRNFGPNENISHYSTVPEVMPYFLTYHAAALWDARSTDRWDEPGTY